MSDECAAVEEYAVTNGEEIVRSMNEFVDGEDNELQQNVQPATPDLLYAAVLPKPALMNADVNDVINVLAEIVQPLNDEDERRPPLAVVSRASSLATMRSTLGC